MKTDKTFTKITDVPEIILALARISDDTDEKIIQRANSIALDVEHYDGRSNRIIDVRRAFTRAVKHFADDQSKPFNSGLVNDIKSFFTTAANAKIDSMKKLSDILKVEEQSLVQLADMGRSWRINNDEKRLLGRQLRQKRHHD